MTDNDQPDREPITLEKATKDLAEFAMERDDLKILLETLPDDADINKTALEYEFQLLKIVCTGWAISYFIKTGDTREQLAESFWMAVKEFSGTISQMTSMSAGIEIDYFEVVRERANAYTQAMHVNTTEADPAVVIGLVFAELCGSPDQSLIITSGRRVFNVTLAGVRNYLDCIDIDLPPTQN